LGAFDIFDELSDVDMSSDDDDDDDTNNNNNNDATYESSSPFVFDDLDEMSESDMHSSTSPPLGAAAGTGPAADAGTPRADSRLVSPENVLHSFTGSALPRTLPVDTGAVSSIPDFSASPPPTEAARAASVPPHAEEARELTHITTSTTHPAVVPRADVYNPQQFTSQSGQPHAVLIAKLQQLSFGTLVRTRRQPDGDAAAADGVSSFVRSTSALYCAALKLIEENVPPPAAVYQPGDRTLPSIPTLSRAYIQPFLREAIPELNERPCMFGTANCHSVRMCRALSDMHGGAKHGTVKPFLPREFLLPEHLQQMETARINGKSAEEALAEIPQRPCILCERAITHNFVLALGADFEPSSYEHIVQSHANIFDREGEYRSDRALMLSGGSFHGLLKPVVIFDRSHYELTTVVVHTSDLARCTVQAWAEKNTIIFFAAQQRSHHATLNRDANLPPQALQLEDTMRVAPHGGLMSPTPADGSTHIG
jgi:hypothetical protein